MVLNFGIVPCIKTIFKLIFFINPSLGRPAGGTANIFTLFIKYYFLMLLKKFIDFIECIWRETTVQQ